MFNASAAAITLYSLTKRVDHNAGFYFSLAVLSSLISIAAVFYAKLPWHAFIALASIPLIAILFEWRYKPGALRIIKLSLLLLIPAGVAIFLTEQITGPIPI
ncbi:hypothetical protein JYT96_02455 [Gammaproteobacteria bacterium AH-315-C21]|nr:hypothetical protein [Gammaproteobacteria bacterium AH-315-C21]